VSDCEICSKLGIYVPGERHHCIFKSQRKGLEAEWNYKYLCDAHHRGNESPHLNKSIDLEYKRGVQQYLSETLYKDYYTVSKLMEVLDLNYKTVMKLVKTLEHHKNGFDKTQVIRQILGGRNYA